MLKKLLVVEGTLEGYAQYPGSDCRNGAVVRVENGHDLPEGGWCWRVYDSYSRR